MNAIGSAQQTLDTELAGDDPGSATGADAPPPWDASDAGVPSFAPEGATLPLAPARIRLLTQLRRLLHLANDAVGLLAHPPRRAPKAPLSYANHAELMRTEAARELRERNAYREYGLNVPMR
jgi:hypothetical protein